jgi:hypothetical protein
MKEIDDIMKDVEILVDVHRNPNLRYGTLNRIRAGCEALVGTQVEVDTGPWQVSADGRHISSDNFDHDVMLKVGGDFYDDASRLAYSLKLAERLNGSARLPQGLPVEPPAGLLYSMALRYRHDFGLDRDPDQIIGCGCTPDEREATLRVMRQLYEEISGHGFFKWEEVTS